MKMSCLRFALVYSCLALFSQSLNAAEDTGGYQLSLERPEAYGNYYAFKSEAYHSIHNIETINGQAQGEDKKIVEAKMVGTAYVTDANQQGEIAEVVIYPNEFEGKVDGEVVKLTIGERLFVQMNDGKLKVFNSNGQAMPIKVAQVMDVLLAFMLSTDEKELSDNEMFALDQPRKPGQSWKCDNQSLAGSLNKVWDIRAEPEQMKSLFTFVKVDKLFDKDAAKLELEIELKRFTVPALAKRGLSIDESAGSVNVQRVLPLDKASMNGKVSKQINLTTTASKDVPDQGKLQVKQVTTHKSQAEYQIQE